MIDFRMITDLQLSMVIITDESSHPCKYHVFLSFRGEDTRNNFTGHLYKALRDKGIITFMDDKLNRGEDISTTLAQAIRDSRISIVVFSENYASSKWCLEELVNIVDCGESNQQMLVPVFYKVDPSDVRNQTGYFAKGLAKHEGKFSDKVPEWKTALTKAANFSGWTLSDPHCSESSIIGEIVTDIAKKVNKSTELDVAEYQVGMERRVQAVQELLGLDIRDVRMVGIWGPGGIGKTTIAKAVYNSIAPKFDGSCFLEDVRETTESARGIVKLQKILLREILNDTELKVTSVAGGITMIKKKLQGKRVLLVLDDVSHMKQLNSLACQCSWFGMGSRIIITTRDEKVLRRHDVHPNLIYEAPKLDYHDALQLFSVNAFKRSRPLVDYMELTTRVIQYAHGLPLALTVLGSSLRGGNVEIWEAALDGSESNQIKDVLKTSLEGLDQSVREAFLDIACFFKGEHIEHVIKVLEACGINKYVINVLAEKALIKVLYSGSIWMHDLVEEMGRDIVHEESPYNPGERSRLWSHEDVYRVLTTANINKNNVRGIKVDLPEDSDVICLCSTTFSSMNNLKLLIHRTGHCYGVFDSPPDSLRVIDWPDCPLQLFPSNNMPRELSIIHMPRSQITVLRDGFKRLKNLTSINLTCCEYLTEVSDLSGALNLQRLDLSGCENLVEVHPSVGFLENLDYLCLDRCSRLVIFPLKVRWKSMRELRVDTCLRLEHFINTADKMESIERLNLSMSSIKQVHSWIGCCTSLEILDLSYTPTRQLPSTFKNLTSLITLNLQCTPLKELPSEVGCLTSLRSLYVNQTLIEELPPSIGNLFSLERLNLSQTLIKELPSSIGSLTSLEVLSLSQTLIEVLPSSTFGSLTSLRKLNLSSTPLRELPSSICSLTLLSRLDASETLIEELPLSIGNLSRLGWLSLRGCVNLRNVPHSVYGGLQCLNLLDVSWCPKLVMFPSRASEAGSARPLLFPQLERLHFEGCNLSEVSEFLSNLDCKFILNSLYLSGSSFVSLPVCISEFLNLEYLELRDCKSLRDISELPPNLQEVELDGCLLLERFSKLSDIMEQRDTPGHLRSMKLSDCNRLMDNLGLDLMSKMAKSLPYQLAQSSLNQHVLSWRLVVPASLPGIQVPKMFDRDELDASVHEISSFMCEILIIVPRNLIVEETGLILCVVFEDTNEFQSFVKVVIDGKYYQNGHYLEAKATESSTRDHVRVYLICIAFKELNVVDNVIRVECYPGHMKLFRSFWVHLANMQEMIMKMLVVKNMA